MSNGHEYIVEERNPLPENKEGFKTYKVERCKKCKILRVQFENINGEWEILNVKDEPPCN